MTSVLLVPVSEYLGSVDILFDLLIERGGKSNVNISHRELPSFDRHRKFVKSHPYRAWYIIVATVDGKEEAVGSIYLTKPPSPSIAGNEFGIFIFEKHQRNGYARAALRGVMDIHKSGPYFANINPMNSRSLALFASEGFQLCQFTLRRDG